MLLAALLSFLTSTLTLIERFFSKATYNSGLRYYDIDYAFVVVIDFKLAHVLPCFFAYFFNSRQRLEI
jgi:hypothetical protein